MEYYFIGKTGIRGKFSLSRPNLGLFLPELTWRHIENFSTNALALHISSSFFSKEDYITDFNILLNEK